MPCATWPQAERCSAAPSPNRSSRRVRESAQTARRGAESFPHLTDRELQVLDLVAAGLSNAAIASRLYLSDKTVRNVVSNVLAKMGASDRADAILMARQAGLGSV